MRWRKMRRIFPWPSRAERRRRVAEIRARAQAEREKAGQARGIEADIQRAIYQQNHIVQAIIEGLYDQSGGSQ